MPRYVPQATLDAQGMIPGVNITAISFRLARSATSSAPAASTSYPMTLPSVGIFVGQAASTDAGSMSTTFNDNYVAGTRTKVRCIGVLCSPLSCPLKSYLNL